MTVIGYARVSTTEQTTARQMKALTPVCDIVREETVSGAKALRSRRVFNSLLADLKKGDKLVVTSLDRLGRSMVDLVSILAILNERGIELAILDMGIDTTNPTGKLLYGVAAAMAEVERDIISERVREGLAASTKAKGKPTVLTPQVLDRIKRGVDRNLKTTEIAKELGISTASVKRGYQRMSISSTHKNEWQATLARRAEKEKLKKVPVGSCADQSAAQ